MSDADDSGFDKEAERKRLREKYENEKEDRAAAEQMSDLLLKGATMTNAHCGQCGSPIFRVDGQEFCPNCSGEAAEADDAVDSAEPAQEPSPDEQLADAISGGGDAEAGEPDSTGGTSIAERAAASVQSEPEAASQGQAGSEPAGAEEPRTPAPTQPSAQSSPPTNSQPSAQPQPSATDASLADAQQALLNAITHHARVATDADPRTATDHLEAAGEAAEALAELSPEN